MPLAETVQIVANRMGGVVKLAEIVGVNVASLYSWRRIPVQHIKRISDASGIPMEQLITGRIEPDEQQ